MKTTFSARAPPAYYQNGRKNNTQNTKSEGGKVSIYFSQYTLFGGLSLGCFLRFSPEMYKTIAKWDV